MGEFEFALMFYHKGQKLRPQIEEFRLGIQKATKAIEDTIGKHARLSGKLQQHFFYRVSKCTFPYAFLPIFQVRPVSSWRLKETCPFSEMMMRSVCVTFCVDFPELCQTTRIANAKAAPLPGAVQEADPMAILEQLMKKGQQKPEKTPKNEKTSKQLLGEFYGDKKHLESLLKDEGTRVTWTQALRLLCRL